MNLTEVIVRVEDTPATLKRKVELATILGTIQSTLTHFQFLSEEWIKNTSEERLLGVSLTGIMDNELTSGKKVGLSGTLESLRLHARKTNEEWAKVLSIPPSASITCVNY